MSMFLDARSFIDALARQIAHQEYDGFPLKLQIAFPDRASFDKHVRLGGITVQEVGGGAVLVHYRGCRIPHLYYPPAPGNYEPVYLRHALRGILPSSEHDTLLKGRNIDHVFPRTAAIRNRIGFVLLLPCDAGSNKSAGGGVEKRQSFDWERVPREYGADWSTLAKFAGLLSPSIASNADLHSEASHLLSQLAQRFPTTVKNEPEMLNAVIGWLRWTRDGA